MKFINKIIALLIVLSTLLTFMPRFAIRSDAATLPSGSKYTDNAVIAERMDQAFAAYPPGNSYFTKNGKACTTCHNDYSFRCEDSPAKCNCLNKVKINGKTVKLNAAQCWAYARYWQQVLFGADESNNKSKFKMISGVSGSLTKSKVKAWFTSNKDLLHPGTHLRVSGEEHSIVLLKVDYAAGKITYAQCNWTSKNYCIVNSLTTISWSGFASEFNTIDFAYVYKNYNSEFLSNALTINYNANGGYIPESVLIGYEYKVNTSDGVNIRSGAGTSYSKIGGYINNTTFTVLETKTDGSYTWGKVNYNGQDGWVALGDWVSKVGPIYDPDFYVSDSMIYKKSTGALAYKKWNYGQQDKNGLHDDVTFNLLRDGYSFKGWSLSPEGGSVIPMDKVITPESIVPDIVNGSKTVVMYAVWEKNTPTVVDKTVESIAISSIPKKSVYYVGDSTDLEGISIIAKHTDGSYTTVSEGFTLSPSVFSSEGKQTVTVNYSGKTAVYTVQVTKSKEIANNATAKANSTGYLLPSSSAATLKGQGVYASDNLQVLCKDGDYYLCLIPWGATTTTVKNGVLMYISCSDITPKSTVPSAEEYYSMNPTGKANAVVNSATKLYYKLNEGAISYGGVEIAPKSLSVGTSVKVLFEIDGEYCIQTDTFTGFVNKSHITLNSSICGIKTAPSSIDAVYGESVSTSALSVQAVMSDGSLSDVTDYSVNLPTTDTVGEKYAVISFGEFSAYVKVNITKPTIKVVNGPKKTSYYVGESFDGEGMKVVLVQSNGIETDVTSEATVSYSFGEAGYSSVKIEYAGASAYTSVLVYEKPYVEVGYSAGHQDETVSVPIYYHSNCEYTHPTSLDIEILYDATRLEYLGANIPALTENGRMIVNSNTEGKLIIAYADEVAIPDSSDMLNLKFRIKAQDTKEEERITVSVNSIELYDAAGKFFVSEIISGSVSSLGKPAVYYHGDDAIFETVYLTYGSTVTVISHNPTKDGYRFIGWTTENGSTKHEYIAGDSFICYDNIELYPVFEKLPESHTHSFTLQNPSEDYLATEASCTARATYYYSCSCGERGEDSFEYGEPTAHSFTEYVSNGDATASQDGTKTAKCDNCDANDTVIDVGSKLKLAEQFINEVDAVLTADSASDKYTAIRKAMITYSQLDEVARNEVSDHYATLQNQIEEYNSLANKANASVDEATKIAFAPLTRCFAFLSELYFLIKKLLIG